MTDEDIVNFMMIPLCLETVRCLEDGIVETAAEAVMGLIYGIGFPPFRGGALRYIDSIGVAEFVALADKYAQLGALCHRPRSCSEMAKNGQKFFRLIAERLEREEFMSLNPRRRHCRLRPHPDGVVQGWHAPPNTRRDHVGAPDQQAAGA